MDSWYKHAYTQWSHTSNRFIGWYLDIVLWSGWYRDITWEKAIKIQAIHNQCIISVNNTKEKFHWPRFYKQEVSIDELNQWKLW